MMTVSRWLSASAGLLLGSACVSAPAVPRGYVGQFERSEQEAHPFIPLTEISPSATLEDAYQLQRDIVARRVKRGDAVIGYRGGLMSAASMKSRGVEVPLAATLFRSGRIAQGSTLSLCGYRKAAFELKIGFLFDRAIDGAKADVARLKAAVARIMPVVDLPDIAYRNPDSYSAVDMVAANVSSAHYVTGAGQRQEGIDPDTLRISLTRDGQFLASGLGHESLGDQWGGLRILIGQIEASGRKVKAGTLVVTGKIGDKGWLVPGHYHADYGALGTIDFNVVACTVVGASSRSRG